MNNPFDYTPDKACDDAFRSLILRLEALKGYDSPEDAAFIRELEAGKMLGVLIAVDADGVRHTLYAFSGQIGCRGFHHEGFVEPVFDYLQPDGLFKMKERDISRQNIEISRFEQNDLASAQREYEQAKAVAYAEVDAYREKCRLSKQARSRRRDSGLADEAEIAEMIRQSQFEKAELHRIKKRVEERLNPFAERLKQAEARLESMKAARRSDSEALQDWLFSHFRVLNAQGESRSLSEIFATTALGVPPSGAGECCAPKLLQAAYVRGWHPLAMAEYWYGRPKRGEVRIHGGHYPACRGKCLPVLGWMLQGLNVEPPLGRDASAGRVYEPEIIFENQWFCVVDKPSGMLSVPGKGMAVSLQQWLADRYPERSVKMVHRLDRDTSGLIIAAFDPESYRILQSLFATRRVRKMYEALLDGDYLTHGIPKRGHIDLPLSPDWLDRPRQRVDHDEGKPAVTDYEFVGHSGGRSRIAFYPLTGRTHQLRLHAASCHGIGMPIAGDPLYGRNGGAGAPRLMLHARKVEFTYPVDGRRYSFESPVPF